MALDRTELDAQAILQMIAAHSDKLYELGARKLGLFGSFARGEQAPDSDIDILVTMAIPSYSAFCDVKFSLRICSGDQWTWGKKTGRAKKFVPM